MIAQLQTVPRLRRGDEHATCRAQTMAETDEHLNNMKRCLRWLIDNGVFVIEARMARELTLPNITVAASPWLHILFRNDCADVGQRQEGNLKFVPWIAVRHGCLIRWEEVAA
jgi:hypothetical protein